MTAGRPVRDLAFTDIYDALLLDMDGTLIHGRRPIEHAITAVAQARTAGLAIGFATNNASRTPQMVAEMLGGAGFDAHPEEVTNSPQVAMDLVKQRCSPGSRILVVGGAGIREEIERAGFEAVDTYGEGVAAVLQGFAPEVGWRDLAEAAYAVTGGAYWVATNSDSTLPTERGFAPGNGSLVAAVMHATGQQPDVAGKPQPAMFRLAAERAGARRPLAVGDRLDTDIEGGNRAGIPTLHVLTGVSSWIEALRAKPVQRPTFIRPDLSFLRGSGVEPVCEGKRVVFADVTAELTEDGAVTANQGADNWRTLQALLTLIASAHPEKEFTGEIRLPDQTIPALDGEDTGAAAR